MTKTELKCWICRRTETELKKEKIMDCEDNTIEPMKSLEWVMMPCICNVCKDIIFHIVSEMNIYTDDDAACVFEFMTKKTIEKLSGD